MAFYIEKNYMNDITLKTVASQFNISYYYFSRIFSNTFNMTFKQYLDNIRINAAESLLQDKNIPITEIAYNCGFTSIRTFNRTYKRIKGHSPTLN